MTRGRVLTAEECQDLAALGEKSLSRIPEVAESENAREVVEAIGEAVGRERAAGLDMAQIQEFSAEFGALLGSVFCEAAGWEWTFVEYDNGSQAYGVAPPNRSYALFPFQLVYQVMTDPGHKNNIVALFKLVQESRLPPMKEKSYLALG